jgi:hypothetical protein
MRCPSLLLAPSETESHHATGIETFRTSLPPNCFFFRLGRGCLAFLVFLGLESSSSSFDQPLLAGRQTRLHHLIVGIAEEVLAPQVFDRIQAKPKGLTTRRLLSLPKVMELICTSMMRVDRSNLAKRD